jgi:hypothetical protein
VTARKYKKEISDYLKRKWRKSKEFTNFLRVQKGKGGILQFFGIFQFSEECKKEKEEKPRLPLKDFLFSFDFPFPFFKLWTPFCLLYVDVFGLGVLGRGACYSWGHWSCWGSWAVLPQSQGNFWACGEAKGQSREGSGCY